MDGEGVFGEPQVSAMRTVNRDAATAPIFALDTLAPYEFFRRVYFQQRVSPAKRLFWELLWDAIKCLRAPHWHRRAMGCIACQAEMWFRGTLAAHEDVSFAMVQEVLDLPWTGPELANRLLAQQGPMRWARIVMRA